MARGGGSARPGSVYHLISRFVAREFFVESSVERRTYLSLLGLMIERSDWRCFSYAIMSNHIHLALLAGNEPLSDWLRPTHTYFAQWINQRRERIGAVFVKGPNFVNISPEGAPHVISYIHQNPVRAGVVADARDSDWTSHRAYLGLERRPPWLDVELGLALGGFADAAAFEAWSRKTRVEREALDAFRVRPPRGRPPRARAVSDQRGDCDDAGLEEAMGMRTTSPAPVAAPKLSMTQTSRPVTAAPAAVPSSSRANVARAAVTSPFVDVQPNAAMSSRAGVPQTLQAASGADVPSSCTDVPSTRADVSTSGVTVASPYAGELSSCTDVRLHVPELPDRCREGDDGGRDGGPGMRRGQTEDWQLVGRGRWAPPRERTDRDDPPWNEEARARGRGSGVAHADATQATDTCTNVRARSERRRIESERSEYEPLKYGGRESERSEHEPLESRGREYERRAYEPLEYGQQPYRVRIARALLHEQAGRAAGRSPPPGTRRAQRWTVTGPGDVRGRPQCT